MKDNISANEITQIIAILAILTPLVTSFINHIFHLVEKRRDIRDERIERAALHQREIHENFLSAFHQVCHLRTDEAIAKYSSYYPLVYIYLDKKMQKDLECINLLISKKQFDEAIKHINTISVDILKQLERTYG